MQDGEVVAAIVAGDPHGFAEAYDRYAAPLYTYCSFMLPTPDDAAGAVRDTFLIASSRLERLRDPGRLRPWLHAVARNECLLRLSTAGVTPQPQKTPGDGALPPAALPASPRGADERGASRGDVRPGGFPEGDRLARAAVVATAPAPSPHRGRGGDRGDGGGSGRAPGHADRRRPAPRPGLHRRKRRRARWGLARRSGGFVVGPPAGITGAGPADAIGHRAGGHNQPGLPGEPWDDAYALGFAVRDVRVAVPVTLRLPVPVCLPVNRAGRPGGDAGRAGAPLHRG